MSSATSTDLFRSKLINQCYDELIVAGAAKAVFGDQGHNLDGSAKAALTTQTDLYNQIISVDVAESDIVIEGSGLRVTGRLPVGTLSGATISEFGIKMNGTLIGVRNSGPKIKDSDEEFTTSMTFLF